MDAKTRNHAERDRGVQLAGGLGHLLDDVAEGLHYNESLHLHESQQRTPCGYCYLRAGRTLGVVAGALAKAFTA